jgi:hypothetical protein
MICHRAILPVNEHRLFFLRGLGLRMVFSTRKRVGFGSVPGLVFFPMAVSSIAEAAEPQTSW